MTKILILQIKMSFSLLRVIRNGQWAEREIVLTSCIDNFNPATHHRQQKYYVDLNGERIKAGITSQSGEFQKSIN